MAHTTAAEAGWQAGRPAGRYCRYRGFELWEKEVVGKGSASQHLSQPHTASSYPHDTANSLWCQESWWTGQSVCRGQNQHMFWEPSISKAPTEPCEVVTVIFLALWMRPEAQQCACKEL